MKGEAGLKWVVKQLADGQQLWPERAYYCISVKAQTK